MLGCCFCLLKYAIIIAVLWFGAAFIVNKLREKKKGGVVIVLGSGGHTGEMLYMMLKYDFKRFKNVYCVVGDNDTLSINKMKNFMVKNKMKLDEDKVKYIVVPRPRKNGEGIKDSLYHQLNSLFKSVSLLLPYNDVECVISNGPGLCLSVFGAYYILTVI